MKYTVYRTVNLIDGKIYVGCHKTENLDDGYLGSGTVLKRAISKYGAENFKHEILHVFDNPNDMFDTEASVVNDEFVLREDTYNLKIGGCGGWDFINSAGLNNAGNQSKKGLSRALERRRKDPELRERMRQVASDNLKGAHRAGLIKYDTFTGRKHTPETKAKIGRSSTKTQAGVLNSNYNKRWVSNLDLQTVYQVPAPALDAELMLDNVIRGKILDFDKYFRVEHEKVERIRRREDADAEREREQSEECRVMYAEYINGDYTSLRDYAKRGSYGISFQLISKRFNKYIPEYRDAVVSRKRFKDV